MSVNLKRSLIAIIYANIAFGCGGGNMVVAEGPIELLVSGQSNAISGTNGQMPFYSVTGHVLVNDFNCEWATGEATCYGGMDMVVPTKEHAIHSNQTWILLGDELYKRTGRDVYIYTVARGGSHTSDFIRDNDWLSLFKNTLSVKPNICANLWIQGESEKGYATQDTYANMRMLIDASRSVHPSLTWFVALDAYAREAQQQLIAEGIVRQGVDIDLLRATPSFFDKSLIEFLNDGHRAHALAWIDILEPQIQQGMCRRQ